MCDWRQRETPPPSFHWWVQGSLANEGNRKWTPVAEGIPQFLAFRPLQAMSGGWQLLMRCWVLQKAVVFFSLFFLRRKKIVRSRLFISCYFFLLFFSIWVSWMGSQCSRREARSCHSASLQPCGLTRGEREDGAQERCPASIQPWPLTSDLSIPASPWNAHAPSPPERLEKKSSKRQYKDGDRGLSRVVGFEPRHELLWSNWTISLLIYCMKFKWGKKKRFFCMDTNLAEL